MRTWRWEEFSKCVKFSTIPVLDLPTTDRRKAAVTLVLVNLPVRRQSSIHLIETGIQTNDLSIVSPTCSTQQHTTILLPSYYQLIKPAVASA